MSEHMSSFHTKDIRIRIFLLDPLIKPLPQLCDAGPGLRPDLAMELDQSEQSIVEPQLRLALLVRT